MKEGTILFLNTFRRDRVFPLSLELSHFRKTVWCSHPFQTTVGWSPGEMYSTEFYTGVGGGEGYPWDWISPLFICNFRYTFVYIPMKNGTPMNNLVGKNLIKRAVIEFPSLSYLSNSLVYLMTVRVLCTGDPPTYEISKGIPLPGAQLTSLAQIIRKVPPPLSFHNPPSPTSTGHFPRFFHCLDGSK